MKPFKKVYEGIEGVKIKDGKLKKQKLFLSVICDGKNTTTISVVDPEKDLQYIVPFDGPFFEMIAHFMNETFKETKGREDDCN